MVAAKTNRPKVMKKRLKEAEALKKKYGGVLPHPNQLLQDGYAALYRYMKRHPKVFKRFKFKKGVESSRNGVRFNVGIRQEHLKTACRLAKNNEGVLPDHKWLTAEGYTRLASYVKNHPRLFTNLPLDK